MSTALMGRENARARFRGAPKRRRRRGTWLRRVAAAVTTAVATFSTAAYLAADAGASGESPIPGQSVVSVTVTPLRPLFNQPVTVAVAWCIPNGSRAGDMVALAIPAALRPLAGAFSVADGHGNQVATASVVDNTITLQATGFVSSHSGVCGQLSFAASIVFTDITVNRPNWMTFMSGGLQFPAVITPIETLGASASQPLIYGGWTNASDQGRDQPADALTWYVESPRATAPSGFDRVVFTARAGVGQRFDCAAPKVEIGTLDQFEHYIYGQRYAGRVNVVCTPSVLTVTTGPVPAGSVVRLVALATIISPDLASFGATGAVAVDAGKPTKINANSVVHYYASATASGSPLAETALASAGTQTPGTAKRKHSGLAIELLVGGIALALVMISAGALSRRDRGRRAGEE
jgi:hypothetical protein